MSKDDEYKPFPISFNQYKIINEVEFLVQSCEMYPEHLELFAVAYIKKKIKEKEEQQ